MLRNVCEYVGGESDCIVGERVCDNLLGMGCILLGRMWDMLV